MPIAYCHRLLVLLLAVFLIGCGARSKSAATSAAKLTPEEQGVSELLKPNLDRITRSYYKILKTRQKYNDYDQRGKVSLANQQSKYHFREFERLAAYLKSFQEVQQPTLAVPTEMSGLIFALRNFEGLRFNINPGSLSDADRLTIEELAAAVVAADERLAAVWRARKADYSATGLSHNLKLEFGGIPFVVDFAKGEIKVKHVATIGPFKWTTSHRSILPRRHQDAGPAELPVSASLRRGW